MKKIAFLISIQFLILQFAIAQITISTAAIHGTAGEVVDVPIYIKSDASSDILAFQFALDWDRNQLLYQGVNNFLFDSFNEEALGTPNETNRPDALLIAWENYPEKVNIKDEVILFHIKFQIAADYTSDEPIIINFCESCVHGFYNQDLALVDSEYEIKEVVLPVKWLDFTAKTIENSHIQLDWSTASEIQNSHFEIDHSTNGKDWKKIGRVQGKANENQQHHYQWLHQQAQMGQNMYRLQQVDWNGQQNTSIIVTAKIEGEPNVVIFQNPVHDVLNLQINTIQPQMNTFFLYNANGQLMEQRQLSMEVGVQTLDWKMSHLPEGLYFLEMVGTKTKVLKIVKD